MAVRTRGENERLLAALQAALPLDYRYREINY